MIILYDINNARNMEMIVLTRMFVESEGPREVVLVL